jgi:hypothetical protein
MEYKKTGMGITQQKIKVSHGIMRRNIQPW